MSDAELRALERLALSSDDPMAAQRYLSALARTHGWSPQYFQQMGRLFELRRMMRLPLDQRPTGWSNQQNLVRNIGRLLHRLNRTGYGGLGPGRASQFSRPEARRWLAELAQRGSATRVQLAQFIRTLRSNPQAAYAARATIGAGGASASLRMMGGYMAEGLAARTAILRAGIGAALRAGAAFVATPAGLAIIAGVLIIGAALWYFNQPSEQERQVASINCDCPNINAGILNAGWIPHCRDAEAALLAKAEEEGLQLETEGGVITGGMTCDSISGPNAWPIEGAPAEPVGVPPRDDESCREFVGLTQRCADR